MEGTDIDRQGTFILCIVEQSSSVPRSPVGENEMEERMRETCPCHVVIFRLKQPIDLLHTPTRDLPLLPKALNPHLVGRVSCAFMLQDWSQPQVRVDTGKRLPLRNHISYAVP